ncbi:MAG: hypothetical protein MJ003_05455 [Paludibacteraceae bacterium]|nr:hypothetical protein [Paludibacteraceae bacterium]
METKNLLNKKITQWLLLVAMLVGCSANAWAYDIYVHPSDASHKMYAWDDESSDGWPGDQFSSTSKFDKYGTWYCWKQHPTESSQKLIFNCGSNSCQTGTINVSSTTYYYYTGGTSSSTLSTSDKYYYSELYLDCRSFTDWTKADAVFRAYFYSDTGCTDGEYIMAVDFSATSTTNVYKTTFTCPIPINGIKVERMKPDKSEGWNNFTINTFSSSYNCAKVTDWNAGSKDFYTACTTPVKGDFTVTNNEKVFNGSPQTATVSGKTGMGTITAKYGGAASQTNVGEYAITVEVAAGDTYCATTSAITLDDILKITKANQSDLTFNGSTQCVGTEVTLNATGGSSGQTIKYEVKSGTGTISGSTLTTDTAGDVVVTATRPGGTNYNDVKKDATFTFVAKPTAYAVSGTASICTGNSTNVTLANSQTGYTYKLYKDGLATSTTQTGTGSALNFSVGAAGTYTVKGYVTGNESCTTDMTGSATITIKNATVTTEPALDKIHPYEVVTFTADKAVTWAIVSAPTGVNIGKNAYFPWEDDEQHTNSIRFKGAKGTSGGYSLKATADGCDTYINFEIKSDSEVCN